MLILAIDGDSVLGFCLIPNSRHVRSMNLTTLRGIKLWETKMKDNIEKKADIMSINNVWIASGTGECRFELISDSRSHIEHCYEVLRLEETSIRWGTLKEESGHWRREFWATAAVFSDIISNRAGNQPWRDAKIQSDDGEIFEVCDHDSHHNWPKDDD